MGARVYAYEVWQDGILVAEVAGANLNDVRREIMRYVMIYAQDGPVSIRGASLAALMPRTPQEGQ